MFRKIASFVLLTQILLFIGACSTDFDVYAPEKEIRVVYGILNATDSIQLIRISRAYQIEGDAIVYASQNDLTLKGQMVKIIGNGETYVAEEVDTIMRDSNGLFTPEQTLYMIRTDGKGTGRAKLVAGKEYTLEIGAADNGEFMTASTTIPDPPELRGSLSTVNQGGIMICLPALALEYPLNIRIIKSTQEGVTYELRAWLHYFDNGNPATIKWGPTRPFTENQGCNEGSGSLCYQFKERQLLDFLLARMPGPGPYTYITKDSCTVSGNTDLHPQSFVFEATSIDKYLSNYIRVNDPGSLDLTTSRPEYTNLTGNIDVIGIFGSYNKHRRYAIMKDCSEYILGLNDTQYPGLPCPN